MYQLEIKNVGRIPEPVMVYVNNEKMPALFMTRPDAHMACRIVESLRSDSAFEYVKVV